MHIAAPSTVKAVLQARKRLKSLDCIIDFYGIKTTKGTLSRIVKGQSVSQDAEAEVRTALGLNRKRNGVQPSRVTVTQNERRKALGATWDNVIELGLTVLETSDDCQAR